MKPFRHDLRREDPDIIRKIPVQIFPCCLSVRTDFRINMEISYLTSRMDPGIRSSGAMDLYLFSRHSEKHVFQFSLNRIVGISLFLPPIIPASVVFQSNADIILHNCSFLISN